MYIGELQLTTLDAYGKAAFASPLALGVLDCIIVVGEVLTPPQGERG